MLVSTVSINEMCGTNLQNNTTTWRCDRVEPSEKESKKRVALHVGDVNRRRARMYDGRKLHKLEGVLRLWL